MSNETVPYWPVGTTTEESLPLSMADIARYLLEDWFPSVPVPVSQAWQMSWAEMLIESTTSESLPNPQWSMAAHTTGMERQWKGFVSWMLGVVGTRRVLDEEGYQWIAPASAFYSKRKAPVTLNKWYHGYPQCALTVKSSGSSTKLRPDYLCARPAENPEWHPELAFVESKGTLKALANRQICPSSWREQAQNGLVEFNGVPCDVARHLVVATRVNPNAKRPMTRRLKIRAWNSEAPVRPPNPGVVLEVARAHYAGILRNIGLLQSELALKSAAAVISRPASLKKKEHEALVRRANEEIAEKLSEPDDTNDYGPLRHVPEILTDQGKVRVSLHAKCIRMIEILWGNPKHLPEQIRPFLFLDQALELEHLLNKSLAREEPATSISRSGVIVRYERRKT